MKRKARIVVAIQTAANIGTSAIARSFFQSLQTNLPAVFPTKWGLAEPLHIRVVSDNLGDLVSLWTEQMNRPLGSFIGYGPSSACAISSAGNNGGEYHQLYYYCDRMAVNSSAKMALLVACFRAWVDLVRAAFGRISLEAEWDAKNVIRQYEESPGRFNPWMVFAVDLKDGLPGVYWMTYFGESLSNWLGKKKLALSPWPTVEELGGGYLLRRAQSPDTWQDERDLDEELVAALGRNRFFMIADPKREVERPPS